MNRHLLSLHTAALLGFGTAALGWVALPDARAATPTCQGPAAQWPEATATVTNGSVRPGGTLTLVGTGWCHPDGAGSRIGVKIDEGAISHLPANKVHANLTIWVLIDADANGAFRATVTMPDATTATSTPALSPGQHTLRLLSGSMRTGDQVRTVATAPFTLAAPGATSGCAAATPPDATVALGSTRVPLGGTVRITGTGWCAEDGTGSRIGVKIDEGAYSHVPGSTVHANATIWAIVEADEDGTFTADIALPDGTAATSTPALGAGDHTLRLLSGSLKAQDRGRTLATGTFTVTEGADAGPSAPAWPHQELSGNGATVWVEDVVATGSSATMRVRGHAWITPSGSASTVALKLSSSSSTQHQRPAGEVIGHPTASGDSTIWALFVPGTPSGAHVFAIAPDGSFEATIDLPAPLADGDFLTATFTSGRFAAGDRTRSITSKPLMVGSARGTEEELTGGVCRPTSAQPTVSVRTPTVAPGGLLRITGTGWCHPTAGGSVIGVKIDEGGYSHLESSVHSNRTIWAVVRAEDSDGTFTADLRLPDGTTATSTPALTTGEHTLRLLSGSLKPGDTGRTLLSEPFVVGTYRPNGTPLPMAAEDLTQARRGGVSAWVSQRDVTAQVPTGKAGDWVHLSVMLPDSSPREPWAGTWQQLDAAGRVRATIPDDAPQGPVKLVLTNGNQGSSGALIGWAPVVLRTADGSDASPTPSTQPRPGGSSRPSDSTASGDSTPQPSVPGPVSPAAVSQLVATAAATPLATPHEPATNFVGLGLEPRGTLQVTRTGSLVRVTLPEQDPGSAVHTWVYGADKAPAGWGLLDEDRTLLLQLEKLAAGTYRLAFQDADGRLIGWTEVLWDPAGEQSTDSPSAGSPGVTTATVEPRVVEAGWSPGPLDGVLLGIGAGMAGLAGLRRRTGGAA